MDAVQPSVVSTSEGAVLSLGVTVSTDTSAAR